MPETPDVDPLTRSGSSTVEPPDFEWWARDAYAGVTFLTQGRRDLSAATAERAAITGLVELLKRVWNARGAADIAIMKAALDEKTDNPPYAELRALDR